MVGVYATLPLSSMLTELRFSQTTAAIAFLTGMFVVGLTVLTLGLRARPAGFEIGIALGIGVVYAMMLFRMTLPERSHMFEYGVVAVLIHGALQERAGAGGRVRMLWLVAIVLTTLVGVIDELLQLVVPHRVFDPVDMLFNGLAATMAVLALVTVAWARRIAARRQVCDSSSSSAP